MATGYDRQLPVLVRAMNGIERRLGAVERHVTALALLAAVLGILAGVVVRFFDLNLPNFGEIAMVAMSPLTFVGAARCTALRRHISIDVIDLVPVPWLRRVVHGVATFATLCFSAYFTVLSYGLFRYMRDSGETLIDLGTPVWIPVLFLVIGMALMCLHAGFDLVRTLLGHDSDPRQDMDVELTA
ncbi:TRAP transporter small permease [Meridianimarinicoccus sp. RP-17]|uniref:TRAP transporter small permease n=1 Tax=Meridianimarinicoccus zhengii TaxID=2056810 RepID=UPI000DABDD21|nr:TRAP transporter small permease [Phycocomes zhengii]